MPSLASGTAYARVAASAADRRIHAAFQWLHLHEQQIMAWQSGLVAIPAPPFGEKPRAEWLAARFIEVGLGAVEIDSADNVLGVLPGATQDGPCIALSAHIDTIFPAGTNVSPELSGTRLLAPGACDNGAGVAALLAIAMALRQAQIVPGFDLLFVANSGEEGEGDLRGMRNLYRGAWRDRIRAHIVLDGAGHTTAVTHALGSLRFLAEVHGPGGHSWTDAGIPNPILLLSRAIAHLGDLSLPESPRTTLNIGIIEGGTAVNAIPERASARFDLRSTEPEQLVRMEVELYRAIEDQVLEANRNRPPLKRNGDRPQASSFSIRKIGDRPAGKLASGSALLETLLAVDRHFSIRTEARLASTDANLPLSLGIPAISLGAGGEGGGIHTRAEWFDARGRELGLRRILLLLLSAAAGEPVIAG